MTVKYAINLIKDGFTVAIVNDLTGTEVITIPQYELSRNNIKGDKVKACKHYNYGNTSDCFIETNNDLTIYPSMSGGVQPLDIGRGDLKIIAFWASPNKKLFTFYYEPVGSYIFDLVP